jgi:hypothetical protein
MPVYSASASKSGTARLPLDRSYIITSSASATATSSESQNDAQTTADTIAEEVAKSVAGNDANIISQALELSPAGIIKAHNLDDFSVSYNFGLGTTRYNGLVESSAADDNNLMFKGGFTLKPSATAAGTLGATAAATLLAGRGSIYTTFAPLFSTNPVFMRATYYDYDVLISIVSNIDVGQFRGALLDGLKHSLSYSYTIRGTYKSHNLLTELFASEIEDIVYSIINDKVPIGEWLPAEILAHDLSLRSNVAQLLDKGIAVAETQVTNAQIEADAKKAVLGGVLEYTLSVQYEDAFTSKRFARANAAAAAKFKGADTPELL